MLALIGGIFCLLGSLFFLLASLGLLRMPDSYNRMQAGTKATTLGSILIFTGIAFAMPHWTLKLLGLIVFILLTNPLSSHALARASHFIGIPVLLKNLEKYRPVKQESRDDLAAHRLKGGK
jgi:multicomponent Na+:H+ antiporter subunit G